MRRLYIRFKSLVNDFVYIFGRAALLLLVEVQNHTVPVRERRRIRDKTRECCHGNARMFFLCTVVEIKNRPTACTRSALIWNITQPRGVNKYQHFGPSSRGKNFFLDFLDLQDGTDRFYRHVGAELPLYAA